eukprot:3078389-Pyramimonas_sp.AAC.1
MTTVLATLIPALSVLWGGVAALHDVPRVHLQPLSGLRLRNLWAPPQGNEGALRRRPGQWEEALK